MQPRINFRCWQKYLAPCFLALLLTACGTVPKAPSGVSEPAKTARKGVARTAPVLPPAGSGRGGYYQDDGPGDNPPDGLADTPDAEPKIEPYLPRANKPYAVFGQTYTPLTDNRPFKQRGVGSWYGKKFHGQKTSSGEPYDMYKMTAAHPTLPIPSYARVTNLSNGAQVIVRINDRGPFHSSRIIDLSYTAALKLGYLGKGSGQLEVERLLPEDIERLARAPREPVQAAAVPASAPTDTALAQDTSSLVPQSSVQSEPVGMPRISTAVYKPQEPENAVKATAVSAPASGFYLQLGAYAQAGNAEAMRSELKQKWANALPPIEVVGYGVFYRLYSGPFATRDEAASMASQLRDGGLAKPLIVQR